ncbi:unnamed protein product, partial [Rotaria sp. Silwood1]
VVNDDDVDEIVDDGDVDEIIDYDLETCIQESGGIEQFMNKPSMILYKKNLKSQDDLKKYILERLSPYKTNVCIFPGIKGTDELKKKINEFYRQNRQQSIDSTIIFKANTSKTTLTQQVLLKNENLYLYVDGILKNKTTRNKGKKIPLNASRVDGVGGEFHEKNRYRNHVKNRVLSSTTYSQNEQIENSDNNEENIDSKSIKQDENGKKIDSSVDLEENDEEVESSINDDEHEISNQGPHGINASTGDNTKKTINWKGGSKNCGTYLLYNKKQEINKCINSILSYGRDHGTLLTGVQLKTLLDIENIEITKDRANGIVKLVSDVVDVVPNPHFIPPTAKRPVFEYYGEGYELSLIHPTKSIPIPSKILAKCKKGKDKKQNKIYCEEGENEEQSPHAIMNDDDDDSKASNDSDNNEIIAINNEKSAEEDINSSMDNEVVDKEEKDEEIEKNISEDVDTDVQNNLENDISINTSLPSKEPVASDNTSKLSTQLKENTSNIHNFSSNSAIILTKKVETEVENVIPPSSSSLASQINSTITKSSNSRSLSQDTPSSVVPSNTLSLPIHSSKSTALSSSHLLPLNPSTSANNQKSSIDAGPTNPSQHSKSPKKFMKTILRSKQKNIRDKKLISGQITSKECSYKRRSFALRSKTKKKQQPSSPVKSPKRKCDDQQAQTTSPVVSSKRKKLNITEKNSHNYQVLTEAVGKIRKKQNITSKITTSSNDFNKNA